MPHEKLLKLKHKIDKHKEQLTKKYHFMAGLSKAIDILLESDASIRVKTAWIEGSMDMIVEVEKFVQYLENDRCSLLKSRLEYLYEFMKKYYDVLLLKYPLSGIIYDGVYTLLQMEDSCELIEPWLNSNRIVLKDIEKEIKSLESKA